MTCEYENICQAKGSLCKEWELCNLRDFRLTQEKWAREDEEMEHKKLFHFHDYESDSHFGAEPRNGNSGREK